MCLLVPEITAQNGLRNCKLAREQWSIRPRSVPLQRIIRHSISKIENKVHFGIKRLVHTADHFVTEDLSKLKDPAKNVTEKRKHSFFRILSLELAFAKHSLLLMGLKYLESLYLQLEYYVRGSRLILTD